MKTSEKITGILTNVLRQELFEAIDNSMSKRLCLNTSIELDVMVQQIGISDYDVLTKYDSNDEIQLVVYYSIDNINYQKVAVTVEVT